MKPENWTKEINKYGLTQEVWTMQDNKPITGTVRSMTLSKASEVIYSIDIPSVNLKLERAENKLFETKEELLNSL